MAKLYRVISFVSWLLGLITTIAAVVFRLLPNLDVAEKMEPRSLLWLAGVFFLGAIATRAVEQSAKE